MGSAAWWRLEPRMVEMAMGPLLMDDRCGLVLREVWKCFGANGLSWGWAVRFWVTREICRERPGVEQLAEVGAWRLASLRPSPRSFLAGRRSRTVAAHGGTGEMRAEVRPKRGLLPPLFAALLFPLPALVY